MRHRGPLMLSTTSPTVLSVRLKKCSKMISSPGTWMLYLLLKSSWRATRSNRGQWLVRTQSMFTKSQSQTFIPSFQVIVSLPWMQMCAESPDVGYQKDVSGLKIRIPAVVEIISSLKCACEGCIPSLQNRSIIINNIIALNQNRTIP